MNFDFTEDQLALRDLVRKFVEREMPKDAVADWDAKGVFPEGFLNRTPKIRLMGASVPGEFGGTGGRAGRETGFPRPDLPTAGPRPAKPPPALLAPDGCSTISLRTAPPPPRRSPASSWATEP